MCIYTCIYTYPPERTAIPVASEREELNARRGRGRRGTEKKLPRIKGVPSYGPRPVSFSLGRLYFRADNISADNGLESLEHHGRMEEPFEKFPANRRCARANLSLSLFLPFFLFYFIEKLWQRFSE